uniref:NADH-ubiquinone oxidoreductase chain 2 n=1 Tax=Stomatella planulata TaxID=529752 RepID=A0A1I9SSX3_9VEST|nr:NADH dehydrogenase subunit 2 [Stomatella planulata]AOZ71843.1 NADH dehydrogenase subunit 2 [Stomatella planulata]
MMSLMPFGYLFVFILVFGTTLSLSSLHWLSIWAGLEINLMGFIPILIYSGASREAESAMKYFIMQALGSGMIMLGSLMSFDIFMSWETGASNSLFIGLFPLIFGLMLKLGSFPFHFWLPSVMAGVSWMACLILTTWQKLAPLFLLATLVIMYQSSTFFLSFFLLLMAALSSLVGGIGGLNQTQVRALLAYSSIGHMGWLLLCSVVGMSTLKIYFLIYLMISVSLFMSLWSSEKSLFSQASTLEPMKSKIYEVTVIFMLLSLGGMPPLLGFFSKWIAIWSSLMSSFYLPLLPLLLGSLISLFYYLSLLFSITLLSGTYLTTLSLFLDKTNFSSQLNLKTLNMKSNFSFLVVFIFSVNAIGGIFIFMALPIFNFL